MSTMPPASAREPKRQRGHLRVAAILDAGAEVFSEKGYDAATMTEIAGRSRTAIGSLYRFFPSKESLADALLFQYAQQALDGLAELGERSTDMTLDGLAGALVDFRLALQSQRSLAIALADSRSGSDGKRAEFRAAMLDGIAGILRKAIPSVTEGKSQVMAVVLVHILKAVAMAAQEKPASRSMLLAEIRDVVRLYLASAQRDSVE
jgi:AcrR family transcriptional regulator